MYQSFHHTNTSRNALCNSACTLLSSVPIPNCSSPTHSSPTPPSYLLNSERKVLTPLVRSSGDRRHPPEWGQQHMEPAPPGAAPGDTLPGAAMPSPPPRSLLTPTPFPTGVPNPNTHSQIQDMARLRRQNWLIGALLALNCNMRDLQFPGRP